MIKDRLQGTFWEFWSELRHHRFSSIKVQRKHWIVRMAAYRKHMPRTHNTQCRVGKSSHFRQSHVFNLPSNPVTCVHSRSQGFRSTRLPSEPQLHQTWTWIFSFVPFWGNLFQFSKHPQQSIFWVIASIEVHVAKVLGHHTCSCSIPEETKPHCGVLTLKVNSFSWLVWRIYQSCWFFTLQWSKVEAIYQQDLY